MLYIALLMSLWSLSSSLNCTEYAIISGTETCDNHGLCSEPYLYCVSMGDSCDICLDMSYQSTSEPVNNITSCEPSWGLCDEDNDCVDPDKECYYVLDEFDHEYDCGVCIDGVSNEPWSTEDGHVWPISTEETWSVSIDETDYSSAESTEYETSTGSTEETESMDGTEVSVLGESTQVSKETESTDLDEPESTESTEYEVTPDPAKSAANMIRFMVGIVFSSIIYGSLL